MEAWHEPYASQRRGPLLAASRVPRLLWPVVSRRAGARDVDRRGARDGAALRRDRGVGARGRVRRRAARFRERKVARPVPVAVLQPAHRRVRRVARRPGASVAPHSSSGRANTPARDFPCLVKVPVETAPLRFARATFDEALELCAVGRGVGVRRGDAGERLGAPRHDVVARRRARHVHDEQRDEDAAARRGAVTVSPRGDRGRRPIRCAAARRSSRSGIATCSPRCRLEPASRCSRSAGSAPRPSATTSSTRGAADMVGIGRPFYAEPDLAARRARRRRRAAPLRELESLRSRADARHEGRLLQPRRPQALNTTCSIRFVEYSPRHGLSPPPLCPPEGGGLQFVTMDKESLMPVRPAEARARAGLHATVRDHADLLALAARLAVPRDGERCWLRIAGTDDFEAWLISWGADSVIPPHDHGESAAALHVVRGRLVEISHDAHPAATWSVRELEAGDSVDVRRGRIHQVENQGPDPALSVHVYSPPLTALGLHPQLDAAVCSRSPRESHDPRSLRRWTTRCGARSKPTSGRASCDAVGCTVATLRSRTRSISTTIAACSRRRIRPRRPGSSRPRREASRGCGPRTRSRCRKCSRCRTTRRIIWCSSGSTKAAPGRARNGISVSGWRACIGPARRRSGGRIGAAPGVAGCRTNRARPGPSSTPRTACCRWPGWRATGGALAPSTIADLERLATRLDAFDTGEPPARLHGDLWAGNRLVDVDGRSWLIDPAAHGGHREFDLAMMRLFGGFGERVLRRVRRGVPARARLGGSRRAAPDRAARRARDQVRRRLRRSRDRRDRAVRLSWISAVV